jgi:hypothetical protein
VPQNYPHVAQPPTYDEMKVKPPPRLSELLPEERALLSEKELLEAASEEDEDLAFLLEYQELLENLEKQRQHLLASDRPPLLGQGSSTSSTRAKRRR